MPGPLISLVVPVYNEEQNVEPFYEAVNAQLATLAERYEFEFVFTDNHSTDRTFALLRELAERDGRVRVLRFSRNFGYQRSILTGYQRSRGAAAIQLDVDLQDPPELIRVFLEHWEQGYRVVYGVRKQRDEGFLVQTARRVFYRLINLLSEDELPLDAGDFRLVDRRVLDVLCSSQDSQPYLRGAIAAAGFRQLGVPYDRAARVRGESKFSVGDLFNLAVDGILNHSTVPLRLATYTGLFLSVVTALGLIFTVFARFAFGSSWPAGFATITILVLLSLSVNALFLGIIGEYLGRIYKQVKQRPLTIVEAELPGRAPERAAEPAPARET